MSQSPPARGCSSEAGCGEGWELGGGAAAWTVRNRKSPSGSIKSPGCLSQQQKLSVGPIIHATGPSLQSALRSCVRYGHRTRTCVRVCVCVGGGAGGQSREAERGSGGHQTLHHGLSVPPRVSGASSPAARSQHSFRGSLSALCASQDFVFISKAICNNSC